MILRSLAIAVPLVLAGCKEPPAPAPEPIRPVKVVEVRPERDHSSLVLPGEIKARWESPLAFRVGGKIARRAVEVGQRVSPGDLLALIDDSDLRLAVNAQQAALEAVKAEANLARSQEERARRLFEKKLAPESDLDQAVRGREAVEAKARAAEAQLATTKHQAGYARLVADQPGIVTMVAAEEGQVVAAGQTILKLARLQGSQVEREVVISTPEAYVETLGSAKLTVELNALKGRSWSGKLRELAPAADPATRTFAARISIIDPDPLLALGMSAQVRAEQQGVEALILPLTALSSKTDRPQVWRLDPEANRVHAVPVTLGPPRGESVVVTEGIAPGDKIVVAGAHLMREGLEVRPVLEGAR